MGQTVVHHHLVIFDQVHFSFVFGSEVVLTLAVEVTLLDHGGGVALVSLAEAVLSLVVLAQIVVERVFAVGSSVGHAQASGRVRDVRVTTSTVVNVDDGLGMDIGQIVAGALFKVVESS